MARKGSASAELQQRAQALNVRLQAGHGSHPEVVAQVAALGVLVALEAGRPGLARYLALRDILAKQVLPTAKRRAVAAHSMPPDRAVSCAMWLAVAESAKRGLSLSNAFSREEAFHTYEQQIERNRMILNTILAEAEDFASSFTELERESGRSYIGESEERLQAALRTSPDMPVSGDPGLHHSGTKKRMKPSSAVDLSGLRDRAAPTAEVRQAFSLWEAELKEALSDDKAS